MDVGICNNYVYFFNNKLKLSLDLAQKLSFSRWHVDESQTPNRIEPIPVCWDAGEFSTHSAEVRLAIDRGQDLFALE